MKVNLSILFATASVLFFSSCASSYKNINPKALFFENEKTIDGITYSTQYDVLRKAGNKKFAKKEIKKNVRVVAIKITNNTEKPFNLLKDASIITGSNNIIPMDPMITKNILKQSVAGYLPYILLTFTTLTISTSNTNYGYRQTTQKSIPIGLGLGPIITGGNMGTAANANKKLFEELLQNDLRSKIIAPGETAFGIVSILSSGYEPISLEKK